MIIYNQAKEITSRRGQQPEPIRAETESEALEEAEEMYGDSCEDFRSVCKNDMEFEKWLELGGVLNLLDDSIYVMDDGEFEDQYADFILEGDIPPAITVVEFARLKCRQALEFYLKDEEKVEKYMSDWA